jgi:capsular polysaccharide export protein
MLQGPATPFFARLADRLRADGHQVCRLNFCAGDVTYWWRGQSRSFRARPAELPALLEELYRRHGITDQVLFGDRRPVHRPAVAQARADGVRTHVFEEGYFRPYWITLEREGVNGHSLLPRDAAWYLERGGRLPDPPAPVRFRSPFWVRALHDVVYHTAGLANPVLFPRYRTHAGITAPVEYAGYVGRFLFKRRQCARDRARALAIAQGGQPYYLLLLQLNTDAQIRDHSAYAHMGEVIDHVAGSFARHAPPGSRLVIKNHPLDPGLMNYTRRLREAERRLDLSGRLVFLEDGDLPALVRRARGVVTVNSTAGLVALEHGAPVLTLSQPIYHLPGLTSQGPLDAFWRDPVPPDPELYRCFRRCVIHATQVNGGFYCRAGIALAVEQSARVLVAERSPLESLDA